MTDAPELSVNVSAPTSTFAPALAVGAAAGSCPAKSAIQELIISTLNIPIHLTDCFKQHNGKYGLCQICWTPGCTQVNVWANLSWNLYSPDSFQ